MRRYAWLATTAACAALATAAIPSSGSTARDYTRPYGRLGFTTLGMGPGPQYGEPSLAWARDGRHGIICTPGTDAADNGTVQYWWTANAGRSWHHSESTSPGGGGDCAVDYLPDGTAVSADLEITDSYIMQSTDWGKTWNDVGPAGQQQDRQWLAHSNDGKTEYLVYHDFVAEAEWFAKGSYDHKTKSLTFAMQDCCNSAQSPDQLTAPGIATTPKSGDPASVVDESGNTFSGPILVDPSDPSSKRLYVVYSISDLQSNLNPGDGVPPYGPTRGVVVAYSADGGQTWSTHYAVVAQPNPDGSQEPTNGAIFPWASIDRAGTLYVVYNSTKGAKKDHFHQYYVYSKNHGKTWSRPVKLDRLGINRGAAIYATSDAAGKGQLAVAWYQTDNGTPSSDNMNVLWRPHIAQVTRADSPHPRVVEQAVTAIPNHRGGICLEGILCGLAPGSADRSVLDFFQVKINPRSGLAGIAYADNAGDRPGYRYGEVVFAMQTKHPFRKRR